MANARDNDDLEQARQYELPDEEENFDEAARLRGSTDSARDGPDDGVYSSTKEAKGEAAEDELAAARHRLLRGREGRKHGKGVAIGGLVCMFCLAYFITYSATASTRYSHTRKVNVILMISDGYGPAAATLAREFVQYRHEYLPETAGDRWSFPEGFKDKDGVLNRGFGQLPLDPLLVGTSRTRSSDSLITDSAAGATAFACGIKTYNGAIGVEPSKQAPCGTVLEAAHHRGYLTGLVATSRITHATPASFYAHVVDRDLEADIAPFLIGDGPIAGVVDLAFGGGERFFLPQGTAGSSRSDDKDLLASAEKNGFRVLRSGADFEEFWGAGKAKTETPVLGLFNMDHMNYEIDRMGLADSVREPTLRNMSLAALQTLSKAAHTKSAHGFFLMIEGSRIDMAEHESDPVGTLYDVLAYQETVRTVKAWTDEANRAGWPTVMISVSDHETGGLALGRQLGSAYPEYLWHPSTLVNATHSAEYLAAQIKSQTKPASRDYVRDTILAQGLGITDATDREIDNIISGRGRVDYVLADMISRRAQIGWSTHGHSGVDVNLYAYPPEMVEDLRGNIENTNIADFIQETMGIELSTVTADLVRNAKTWHKTDVGKQSDHSHLTIKAYSHEF